MSRFNNPKALSTLLAPPAGPSSVANEPLLNMPVSAPVNPPSAAEFSLVGIAPQQPNIAQRVCFYTLCAYLLSALANEFSTRLFHGKAYISTVTVVLLPFVLLTTGTALRGLRVRFGKWWIGFGIWLAICAPFSVWKSDTIKLLFNYYARSFILYFVVCASVIALWQVRNLMFVAGFANFLVVLTCWKYGVSDNGRFAVEGSVFSSFANANELALQLLLGIIVLLYPFFRPGLWGKIASLAVIGPSAFYMLKTGSRAVMLGVAVTTVAFLVLTPKRMRALAVLLPLAVIVMVLLPANTRHRLMYVAIGDKFTVASEADASDLGSQLQRERLFKSSVRITLEHPIFGVGPGEFIVADSGPKSQTGVPAAWRQTHNSYTQVSSEAGLPGFILYVGSLLLCFGMSYRCYRQTVGRMGLEDCAGVSFCMTLSVVAYAICTIFDHLAYTSFLPMTGGIATVTYFIARDAKALLDRREARS